MAAPLPAATENTERNSLREGCGRVQFLPLTGKEMEAQGLSEVSQDDRTESRTQKS